MNLPENGASMADAANTRENEGPCICDGCNLNPEKCGMNPVECQAAYEAGRADDAIKARKERDL